MTDDDVRSLLRSLRDEPVPADSLARVRLAVAERRQAGMGRFVAVWKFAGVFGAMAVVVLIAVLLRPVEQPATPVVKIRESAITAKQEPPPRPSLIVEPERRKTVAKKVRKAMASGENIVVRIETADPDVVILLIGD